MILLIRNSWFIYDINLYVILELIMRILSVHVGHDASSTVIEDGEVKFYQVEERLCRDKHNIYSEKTINKLVELGYLEFDQVIISCLDPITGVEEGLYGKQLYDGFKSGNPFKVKEVIYDDLNHHREHAYGSFYHSGFEEALCFVLDGAGSRVQLDGTYGDSRELETVYHITKNSEKVLFKHYFNEDLHEKDPIERDNIKISGQPSVGWLFEDAAIDIGFKWSDAGKVMGLAQYKGYEKELSLNWVQHVNLAHKTQKITQEKCISLIRKYADQTGIKDIVITGGYGLNCVANYEYLDKLSDLNIYIDPVCFDAGNSIGCAYYYYLQSKKDLKPLNSIYILTNNHKIDLKDTNNKDVSYDDIADLLIDGNIVSMFQGQAECGQRSLGNRTLMFDPRVKDGKDIVNRVKQRESFRPFAGTILLEHAEEWFDMRGLDESPYMLYAMKCLDGVKDKVPAIVHVDNTCRIQTVTEDQNYHFYNVIKSFHKKTGIPILLNTSFNLAGDPLVETFDDALDTLERSELNYLYLPELSKLVSHKC